MTDREKVIKGLETIKQFFGYGLPSTAELFDSYYSILNNALALLKEQETVVRCKDCKHATMTSDGEMCKYCEMDTDDSGYQREVYHDADWFCADGERRDDDG